MSISRLTTSGKITHAAISPDGKYAAYVTQDAEGDSLWVRQVAAPSSLRIAGPAATEYVSVTFATDGDSVYYLTLDRDKGHTTLYRVPVLGGPSSVAADNVGPVGFSRDGRQIAFVRASVWLELRRTAPFFSISAISLSAMLSRANTSFSPMQSRLLS